MTMKTYCGNLLWQSGLTLLAPNDLLKFPVKAADIPAGKEPQRIKRLRLHIDGEAPRLLAVQWKGVSPANVVAGLFSAVPHASQIFNEDSYNIFEVETV